MDRVNKKFNKEKLIEAREARGFTREMLFAKTEIPVAAISDIENGILSPKPEVIEAFASVLHVPSSYFYKMNSRDLNGTVFTRMREVRQRNIHIIRMKWLIEIRQYLEKFYHFPELDIPISQNSVHYEPVKSEHIETMASEIRKLWKLGHEPIQDIIELLEKKGVIFSQHSIPDHAFKSYSTRLSKKEVYICLDSKRSSAFSHLDAAHELGHLVLHPSLKVSEWNDHYHDIEAEADRFATAFLLPASSFGAETKSATLKHMLELKKRWKVPLQTIAKRAYKLDKITDVQHVHIRQALIRNGLDEQEPLDNEIHLENPSALKNAIQFLIESKETNINQLLEEISLNIEEIEALTLWKN